MLAESHEHRWFHAMPKALQTILVIALWAIVSAGCALPAAPPKSPLNSPLNSPMSSPASAVYVAYSERNTTIVYAPNPSEVGAFGFLALIGGKIVRVDGCLLLEMQPGDYVLPIWSNRVRFTDSGSDERVVAANGKTVGTVGKSINRGFGGGYYTLTEADRQYPDELTPTCKRTYDAIAWVNLR
jgi:hypothetical protein